MILVPVISAANHHRNRRTEEDQARNYHKHCSKEEENIADHHTTKAEITSVQHGRVGLRNAVDNHKQDDEQNDGEDARARHHHHGDHELRPGARVCTTGTVDTFATVVGHRAHLRRAG